MSSEVRVAAIGNAVARERRTSLVSQIWTVTAKDLRSEMRTKEAVNASVAFSLDNPVGPKLPGSIRRDNAAKVNEFRGANGDALQGLHYRATTVFAQGSTLDPAEQVAGEVIHHLLPHLDPEEGERRLQRARQSEKMSSARTT